MILFTAKSFAIFLCTAMLPMGSQYYERCKGEFKCIENELATSCSDRFVNYVQVELIKIKKEEIFNNPRTKE